MSETNIENDPGYGAPPPQWLERLAIAGGVLLLLILSALSMLGAAVLLLLSGY